MAPYARFSLEMEIQRRGVRLEKMKGFCRNKKAADHLRKG